VENKDEPTFSRIIQIGVVVKDIEKTVARLTALGLGPFKNTSLQGDREEWYRDKRMFADFKFAKANIGDIELELIQPVSGDSPHKDFLESRGEGIQHIACPVEDVQQAVDKLTGLGVEVILRAKVRGGGGVAYCDLGSGLIIELIQKIS
jgi:methylmalonyl-CoA/ethylmalonyl-CoA epimerase